MAARGHGAEARQNLVPPSGTDVIPAGSRGAVAGKIAPAPSKRQRVSRACDQCRAMREKCDGTQPQCSSCVAQNRPCTYKTSPKKRGVQTGYIRTLELTLSSLLDEVPGCSEALDRLFSKQGEAQRLFNPDTGGQQDLERHNRLHRRWNKSRARREINRILSADSTNGPQIISDRGSDDGTDTDVGPRAGAKTPSLNRPPTMTPWSPSETTNPSPMTAGSADDGTPMAASRSILALPLNHRQLLDIYFSYSHCWFPILERRDLLRTAHQCEREVLEPSSASAISLSESSFVAELWAVMALASYQDAASMSSAVGTVGTATRPGREDFATPQRIYNMARRIIPLDDGPFEIQHARALLILALINIGQRKYTAARMQVGMARQAAQESSSTSDPANPRAGHHVVDAVLVGCCILDAMSAIVRNAYAPGGPGMLAGEMTGAGAVSVHSSHSCTASVPEDGLDEWQTWAPCLGFSSEHAPMERGPAYALSTFNQLHVLMRVVQQQMAASVNDSPRGTFKSPEDPIMNDLYALDNRELNQAIRYDLPSSSFIRANDQTTAPVPSVYVVRIAFIWAHIILNFKHGATGAAHSLISALADIVEQFILRFGAAATPPIFVPIVLSVVQSSGFLSLQRIVKQRWHVLADVVESTWNPRPGRETTDWPKPGTQATAISGPISTAMPSIYSPDNGRSITVPGQYAQHYQTAPPVRHGASTGYVPQSVVQGYGYHRTSLSPHAPGLFPDRNIYHTPALHTLHPTAPCAGTGQPPSLEKQNDNPRPTSPNYTGTLSDHTLMHPSVPPLQTQQLQQITPNAAGNAIYGAIPTAAQLPLDASLGSGMDYDSLLDDLASTDYLERLDADIGAQFMANLGFAPGSDNVGEVMGEYSGL